MLELDRICTLENGKPALSQVSLALSRDSINILLGPTLSGKTSLLRIMAGLDKPASGDIRFNGESVLGVPVQKRKVAMVYQQFINYPSLTVFENIASPLRVAKLDQASIKQRVSEAAELLRISALLDRQPDQLSGGQQQRVAVARALVKRADLVLLDEPLANLDYKLREELRSELPQLFSAQGSLLVYATTEPTEALLLGGHTAVMHQGTVSQFGATLDVFYHPANLSAARVFSDPPLNTAMVVKEGAELRLGNQRLPLGSMGSALADAEYAIGLRPHHIYLHNPPQNCFSITGRVSVSEITGSESYVHFDFGGCSWVALQDGIHAHERDETLILHINPETLYFFHPSGQLALAPARLAA